MRLHPARRRARSSPRRRSSVTPYPLRSRATSLEHRLAARRSSFGSVNETSVCGPRRRRSGRSCRCSTPPSASGRKMRAGDARMIGDAEDRDLACEASCAIPRRSPAPLLTSLPTQSFVVGERRADVKRQSVVASVFDGRGALAPSRPRRPARASPRNESRSQLARLRDDPRVGREDALDVGVDLARLGLQRGRQCDCGRVGAARPSVVGSSCEETPWKPATIATLPSSRA
jgi:hypothetical protein